MMLATQTRFIMPLPLVDFQFDNMAQSISDIFMKSQAITYHVKSNRNVVKGRMNDDKIGKNE